VRVRERSTSEGVCVCMCVFVFVFVCIWDRPWRASAHVCEVRERASKCVQCVRVCVHEIYSFLCRERACE
jgi:hypothetical protein